MIIHDKLIDYPLFSHPPLPAGRQGTADSTLVLRNPLYGSAVPAGRQVGRNVRRITEASDG